MLCLWRLSLWKWLLDRPLRLSVLSSSVRAGPPHSPHCGRFCVTQEVSTPRTLLFRAPTLSCMVLFYMCDPMAPSCGVGQGEAGDTAVGLTF